MAHRYSYLHYIGELKDRWELVCHKCDNPSCVSPFHLFKGNQTENINDMVAKGRQGRHAKHGSLRRAYFYKCDCNLCKEYKKLKTYKQKMHERRKYLADIL